MSQNSGLSRRTFLRTATATTAGVAAAATWLSGDSDPAASAPAAGDASGTAVPGELNETVRMHNDLQSALAKEPASRQWGMVIDVRRCIGCSACTVACMAENNLPPRVTYRTVPEIELGDYPDVKRHFMPTNCMQCAKAPCIDAANKIVAGSMGRRPDGIVTIDYTKMKGRKVFEAAKAACPYSALYFDGGGNHTDGTPKVEAYEGRAAIEYGKSWTRRQTNGTTRKCHFCTQRLDAGQLPACVTTCTGQAMHFGDLSDPQSLVAEIVKAERVLRLEQKKGLEPRVLYIAGKSEESCMTCHSF